MENQLPPIQQPSYDSLLAIRTRKEQLRADITKDDAQIRALWKDLFRKPETTTSGLRISGLMSTGAGILDGLILGWKLYRKYKGFTRKRR